MLRFREIRKDPFSTLGRFFAFISIGLIILLFLINFFLGGLNNISNLLLIYALPIFLFLSIILLATKRIKDIKAKHYARKVKRIRKERVPPVV